MKRIPEEEIETSIDEIVEFTLDRAAERLAASAITTPEDAAPIIREMFGDVADRGPAWCSGATVLGHASWAPPER